MSRHERRRTASNIRRATKSAPRKYMSEHSVLLCTSRFLALPASQLTSGAQMDEVTEDIAKSCHIYLIARRPRPSFDPDSLVFADNRLSGNLLYRIQGMQHSEPFSVPFYLTGGAVSVGLSPYPHREIQTLRENAEVVLRYPAFAMVPRPVSARELVELEVLYVGQAYAGGRRSAFDRLKSHSTLQKILADMQETLPDDEAIILTFEYPQYRVMTKFDGSDPGSIRDDSDGKRYISIMDNPLTEEQQICLAEAGLIRYFQPKYNEIYKNSFPKNDQKILNSCYDLDFSGLVVEIDTNEVGFRLFSSERGASAHHIAKFDLFAPAERGSFFSFLSGTDEFKIPGVISPT